MKDQDIVANRYISKEYLELNPTWDSEDSPWKALHVLEMLRAHDLYPRNLADIGCGAGQVLAELKKSLPDTDMMGFDIAPDAQAFWKQKAVSGITLRLGDFFQLAEEHYDVLLLLDVLEHVRDPHDFLEKLKTYGDHFIIHLPLDLSASSVLREEPLLYVRRKVGHIHYFTCRLALALLAECGYEVIDWKYTGAAFTAPQRNWKTRAVSVFRRVAYALSKDFGVRLLGGETLIVLARPSSRQ